MSDRNSTEPVRAVFYGRCSTDRQETSVDDQLSAVQPLAQRENYVVVRKYVDDGISGDATERREAFQRMIRDAERLRDFEVILCWDQDRFGRFDPLEAGYWIQPLRAAGVRLETIAQGRIDWESFQGRVLYTLAQEGKKQFLIDLSRNSLRGMLERAREGFWMGGAAPFGYKAVDAPGAAANAKTRKRPQVLVLGDPHKVEVVRWLFRTYAEKDVSLRWLAEELHRRGVPSPRGHEHWSSETVRAMLARREYLGDYDWGAIHHGGKHGVENGEVKAKGRKIMNRKGTRPKRVRVRPEDLIVVKQTHPAIIDRGLWEAVQAKLAGNQKRTTPVRAGGDWLLSGLLTCGHCGSKLMGYTNANHARRDARVFRKYKCSGYAHYGRTLCHHHAVNEKPLLDVLIRKLQDEVLNPDTLQAERDEIERQEREAAAEPAEAARFQSRIAALEADIAQANLNMARAKSDEAVEGIASAVRQFRAERDGLAKRLEAAEKGVDRRGLEERVRAAEEHLWRLREAMASGEPADVRAVLRAMVEKVELWWECSAREDYKKCVFARGIIHLRADSEDYTLGKSATPALE